VAQYKEKGDMEKIDKHILRIKSSVNHLTSILNDFLSLGRLEEGKIEVTKEPVILSEFFKEIKEELKPILKEGQVIQVTCNLKDQSMETDRRLIRNILFNLISNASKYSDSGKTIYLECNKKAKSIFITVRDEGIGIPENEVKHLFERFFRASNATNIQGTGLGLNIVNRYVDLLKGKIDFTSIEGKGTTFTVILPLP
jgi:signal transduction histidine kinase